MSPRRNVHGTAVLLGGAGVLIRGPSGSGKSLLALQLLETWSASRRAAWLVSDDRVELARTPDSLVMSAPARIAGLIELRGRGILTRRHVGSAPLDLVVDLTDELVRMPGADAFTTELEGVRIARCPVPRSGILDVAHQLLLVAEGIRALRRPLKPVPGKKSLESAMGEGDILSAPDPRALPFGEEV